MEVEGYKVWYNQTNLNIFFPQFQYTVAAPSIAAASNQKIFSGQVAAASIRERPLIKK